MGRDRENVEIHNGARFSTLPKTFRARKAISNGKFTERAFPWIGILIFTRCSKGREFD